MVKDNKIDNNNGLTSTYIATSNQSIFDVAVDVHGTVDGVSDLLVNNSWLSIDTDIQHGDKIVYTSGVTLDEYEAERLDTFQVVPAHIDRGVYYRPSMDGNMVDIFINDAVSFSFDIHVIDGDLKIDWGDNYDIEKHTNFPVSVHHIFNDDSYGRRIRLYITGEVKSFSVGNVGNINIMSYDEVNVLNFKSKSNIMDVRFFNLFKDIQKIYLPSSSPSTLEPLALITSINELELTSSKIKPEVLDEFFIAIVDNYGDRLPAKITTVVKPNGVYKEPDVKNEPQNGMEAVWVLVNEPAWNTDYHKWSITIDSIEYSK